MKKSIFLSALLLVTCTLTRSFGQESFKWAEMNSFHATAMSSFHSAEANKFQPVRDSAEAILKKAALWQQSAIPAGIDANAIKPLLQNLSDACKAIQEAVVAKKGDAALRPLVMKAHNIFHTIISKTR
jgi:hypothetical protein